MAKKQKKVGFELPLLVVVTGIISIFLGGAVGFKMGKASVVVPKEVNVEKVVTDNELRTAVSLLAVMKLKYDQGEIGLPQAMQIGKELVEGMSYGKQNQGKFVVRQVGKVASESGSKSAEFLPFGFKVWTDWPGGDW